jgi:hypothetical protein
VSPRRRGALACGALLALCACATAGSRRDAELAKQLDAYQFRMPLAEVWPTALRVVSERGYTLVGHDRELIGKEAQGAVGAFFSKGFETREAGGQRAAETEPNAQNARYRIVGAEAGGNSRVEYYVIYFLEAGVPEQLTRDPELELTLVRRLDPGAATRIEAAAAPAAPR